MKKRILTVLLAVCLVFALGTVSALAADGNTTSSDNDVGSIKIGDATTYYTDAAEFVAAVNSATEGAVVDLKKDIDVDVDTPADNSAAIVIDVNMTFNGNGHKITAKSTGSADTKSHVLSVEGNVKAVINGLTIDAGGVAHHGIHVYNGAKAELNTVTISNYCAYGLVVNNGGASVKANNFEVLAGATGCWGSVNVDAKSATASIEVNGGNFAGDFVFDSQTSGKNTAVLDNVVAGTIKTNTNDNDDTVQSNGTNKITITDSNVTTISLNGAGTDTVVVGEDSVIGSITSTNTNTTNKPSVTVNDSSVTTAPAEGSNLDFTANNSSIGGTVTNDSEARIGSTYYATLAEAVEKANANQTIVLMKDVSLTTELSITKNITINGNGKKLTLTAAGDSQGLSIGAKGTASVVTLDNVKLTITGTQNTNADGIDVWGTLNLKNSTVSMSYLRSAFVMQGGLSAKLNINNSAVIVEDITGNGTNGGNVVIDASNVTFDNVGSHALSVEEITVTDSSLSFTDVAYCALYGQEIVLDSGADVEIEDCGTGLPHDGWGGVKYQAPVQVKVVAGDTDNGITVKSGASLTVTGTNDAIYIPEGTGFVSNGYVSADIDLGDDDMNVVTFVKNSIRHIELVKDGTEIELPDPGKYLGREFVGWECSLNDRVYPEGYEYTVTSDVTFTAVWEAAAYDIVIDDDILHGDIWTSPKSEAEAGDTVHVYADPDAGYVLEDLSVTYRSGRYELKLTRVSANHYTFTMPAYDVYITATFRYESLPFTDVNRSQWFYDEVYYVYTNGMMEGDSATTFNPDGRMTRAMFWAVLGRIDGATITGNDWAEEARAWAMREGVSDGTNPNDYVTREQMVTMLWRYAGEKNGSASLIRYTDADKISSYAVEAMRWAIGNGIIEGMTSTTLEPQGTATRAQCAAIFMRFDQM